MKGSKKIKGGLDMFHKFAKPSHGIQIEISTCSVEFRELSNKMSDFFFPGGALGSIPNQFYFPPSFGSIFGCFPKKIKMNSADITEHLLKTN